MDKIYNIHGKIYSEKSVRNYLLRLSESNRKHVRITVYNFDSEIRGDFIDSEIIQNKRDLQLKSILEGSNLSNIIEKIRSTVFLNKTLFTYDSDLLLRKLQVVNDEKSLSDLIGSYGNILFKLDRSVEWYKTLLSARSFQGIPRGTFKKVWDNNTRKYIEVNNEEISNNFDKAKEEMKNEKKKENRKVISTKNKI